MRCVKMSKKILVVGGGGREHAIIKALKKSPDCGEVWCAPGTSYFLIETFYAFRKVIMNNPAYIGFINSHPESNSGGS